MPSAGPSLTPGGAAGALAAGSMFSPQGKVWRFGVCADRFDLDVAFAIDTRRGRDPIVAAAELQPMAGVVEEADGAGAGAFQSRAEFLNGSLHGDLIRVAARDHVESEAGQCIADQFRVVGGIGQGAAGIVAVA